MPGLIPAKLEEFIKNSGISYKSNGRSFIFDCPLCHKNNKLYIRKSDGLFVCFVCKNDRRFRGAAEFALQELTRRSLDDIRQELYGLNGPIASQYLDIKLNFFIEDEDDLDELFDEEFCAPPEQIFWPWDAVKLDHTWARPGVDYLQGRGVPAKIAIDYDIRYSPTKRTILFPVKNAGTLVGYQHRIIDPELIEVNGELVKRLKTWSSDDMPRESMLMFQHRVTGDHAILTEGPMDCLKTHFCGGGVASMGKAVSKAQIEILLRSGIRKLYLALDPDAASEIIPIMEKVGKMPVYQLEIPPEYKDIGDVPMRQVPSIFSKAKELSLGQMFVYFKNQQNLRKGV